MDINELHRDTQRRWAERDREAEVERRIAAAVTEVEQRQTVGCGVLLLGPIGVLAALYLVFIAMSFFHDTILPLFGG